MKTKSLAKSKKQPVTLKDLKTRKNPKGGGTVISGSTSGNPGDNYRSLARLGTVRA